MNNKEAVGKVEELLGVDPVEEENARIGYMFRSAMRTQRVVFPPFQISSQVEISLSEIKERRFDLIERHSTFMVSKK